MPEAKARFEEFLAKGQYGDMEWLANGAERRGDPRVLWPDVRSIVMLGMNYGPEANPLDILEHRDRATCLSFGLMIS